MANNPLKFAVVLCALAMAACAGQKQETAGSSTPLGLPPIPVDRASSSVSLIRTGIETLSRSAETVEAGTELALPSAETGLRWATYHIQTGPKPLQASVTVNTAETSEYWVALANFAAQRWDLSGPYTANKQLAIDPATHRSALGNVFLAVIAMAGQKAQVVQVSVLDRQPPVAVIDYASYTTSNKGGATQYFDAANSYAEDGALVKYEWDLDGDGTYEFEQAEPIQVMIEMPSPAGRRMLRLRVTDDGGLSDVDEMPLSSSAQLANPGSQSDSESPDLIAGLAMVDGYPAVCWEEGREYQPTYRIKYRRFDPTGGYPPVVVAEADQWSGSDATDQWSGAPAFAVINGLPAAVYSEFGLYTTDSQVWYSQATDVDGSAWSKSEVAFLSDPSQDVVSLGEGTLLEVQGQPALLYGSGNYMSYKPHYVRSSDPAGTAWPAGIELQVDTFAYWRYNKLFQFAGDPLAGFWSGGNPSLFFAEDPAGASWLSELKPFPVSDLSLLAVGDQRMYAINLDFNYNTDQHTSTFMRSNSTGLEWSGEQQLSTGTIGNACLATIDSRPWYFWTADRYLYCRKALDPQGEAWGPIELIDVTSRDFLYQMQVSAIDTGHSAGIAWTSCDSTNWETRAELYYDELPY